MSPGFRRTVDLSTTSFAMLVSLFLVVAGLTTPGGVSGYLLVLGMTGVVGFGLIEVQLARRRPLARGDRLAVTLVTLFVGVLSGSVVVLPLLLVVAIWFAATAVVVSGS